MATENRVFALDGLRGVMAFVVVVSHIVAAFIPTACFGDASGSLPTVAGTLSKTPLFVFWSGTFAVFVFFVLSGFVLSASVSGRHRNLPVDISRRYLRLVAPMLASALIAYALTRAFPNSPADAASLHSNSWLAQYYIKPAPTFGNVLLNTLVTVFWTGASWVNAVLWTMKFEFFGSICIYIFYAVFRKSTGLILPVLVVPILLFIRLPYQAFNLVGFPMGLLIFELWRANFLVRRGSLWIPIVLIGLLLGGQPYTPSALYTPIEHLFPHSSFAALRSIGAAFLVVGILCSIPMQRLLTTAGGQFLGRISFALYLIHFPILLTALASSFAAFSAPTFGLIIPLYVAAILALAFAFTVLIDEPVVALLHGGRLKRHASVEKIA